MSPHSWTSIPFTFPSLSAFPGLSTPPGLKVSEADNGASVTMGCMGKTDWWRVPFEGDEGKPRDDRTGPAFGFSKKVGKEGFEVRCEVAVGATVQAQLLFYLSPTEWVKVGVEYDNDALWCGVVVCNPFSDWSIQPPPAGKTTFTISYNPGTTTLRVYLNDVMMREVKSFGTYSAGYGDGRSSLHELEHELKGKPEGVLGGKDAWIGVMACSPLGSVEEGEMAKATFKGLEVRAGTR